VDLRLVPPQTAVFADMSVDRPLSSSEPRRQRLGRGPGDIQLADHRPLALRPPPIRPPLHLGRTLFHRRLPHGPSPPGILRPPLPPVGRSHREKPSTLITHRYFSITRL